jgi:hypothetical protein
MRFGRRRRALDQLADALRRAEITWQWDNVEDWSALPESAREEWRALARTAASSAYEELHPADRRVPAE